MPKPTFIDDLDFWEDVMAHDNFRGYHELGWKIMRSEEKFEDPFYIATVWGWFFILSIVSAIACWWFGYSKAMSASIYTICGLVFFIQITAVVYGFLVVRHMRDKRPQRQVTHDET